LGTVLLTAAVLKGYELATLPLLGRGLLNQRWLLAAVVEVELVFGGWLLVGLAGRWTWAATGVLWLAFLGIAGYEAVTGAGSCGCFGRVRVDPLYTTVFDLAVILALPFCRPLTRPAAGVDRRSLHGAAVALLAVAGAAFGTWDLSRYSPARLAADGLTFADGTVVLEPDKWVGRRFALAEYIDIGPDLARGDWIVLLYRYDCDHCQRTVPRYAGLAARSAGLPPPLGGLAVVALVEIPPYAPASQKLVRPDMPVRAGQLTAEHNWFASTPVAVRLHEGQVVATAEGNSAENPSAFGIVGRDDR
jgi:hypothetical protein